MPIGLCDLIITFLVSNADLQDLAGELPIARVVSLVVHRDPLAAANVLPKNRQAAVRPQ